jgi:hypothetical protein
MLRSANYGPPDRSLAAAGGIDAQGATACRGDDHLQHHRGDRGDFRRHGGQLNRADRFRVGLGHRGRLGRGRGLAILRLEPEAREHAALKAIALSFFALAAYITVESIRTLLGADAAEHSTVGIVLAALSLLIMPLLSYAQRRAGRELGSASAVADSKQTLLCTYLSGVLLVGLLLNRLFGWSWADPLVALVIAVVAVKEGREAWHGKHCC